MCKNLTIRDLNTMLSVFQISYVQIHGNTSSKSFTDKSLKRARQATTRFLKRIGNPE